MDPSQPFRIILADDDKDDRLLFQMALNELPVFTQLTTVNDGEQLMKFLFEASQQLPNVLFLDLNMPRKNGFECLFEIKSNKNLKQLPVIMFSTSYPQNSDYEKEMVNMLYKYGAQYHICKPNDFEQLKKAIYDALIMVIENKFSKY